MIDHFCITVSDLGRSKAFYQATLAPLGYRPILEYGSAVGFGVREGYGISSDPAGDFWIAEEPGDGTEAASRLQRGLALGCRCLARSRLLKPAARTMAPQASDRNITNTTTPPSCSTPTVITSKRSIIWRNNRLTPSKFFCTPSKVSLSRNSVNS